MFALFLTTSFVQIKQEPHGGDRYLKPHRRLHAYAPVRDLRFLPISRVESAFIVCAAMSRADSFDDQYMEVLKMRVLEALEVYEFDN